MKVQSSGSQVSLRAPWEDKKHSLTQNMQDRQIQVRAGSARAVGKLRETDGMVTAGSDWCYSSVVPSERSPVPRSVHGSGDMTIPGQQHSPSLLSIWSSFLWAHSSSPPLCWGKSFTKLGRGVLSACPHHSKQRGRGARRLLYISFAPPLSPNPCCPPSLPLSPLLISFIP